MGVDLAVAPQAEAPQASGATDVRKHRLDGRQPATVVVAAPLGVDLRLHARTEGRRRRGRSSQEEYDLPDPRALGMFEIGASCLLCVGWRPTLQTPKTTRVPVDGITSVFGIAMCTAMIMFTPEQCMGMM